MTAPHTDRSWADSAAEQLKIYAQPQRLMILRHLLDGEYTVGEIDGATGIGQPALSQQLAELRRADLVMTRRAAKQVYYRLASDTVALRLRCIEAATGAAEPAAAIAAILTRRPQHPQPPRQRGAASFVRIAQSAPAGAAAMSAANSTSRA